MSRNLIISLAAAAALAATSLASTATYARGFGGIGGGHMMTARVGGNGGGAIGHRASLKVSRISGGTLTPGKPGRHGNPRRPGRPPVIIGHLHDHHHHWHWVLRGGRWIEVDEDIAVAAPVDVAPVSAPGPCTCLTKTYTPEGLVVFADVCTKESVSAPATEDHADATKAPSSVVPATATPIAQVPTKPDYAGRSYQDYLAANPQAVPAQASSQAPQQGQQASQQN